MKFQILTHCSFEDVWSEKAKGADSINSADQPAKKLVIFGLMMTDTDDMQNIFLAMNTSKHL